MRRRRRRWGRGAKVVEKDARPFCRGQRNGLVRRCGQPQASNAYKFPSACSRGVWRPASGAVVGRTDVANNQYYPRVVRPHGRTAPGPLGLHAYRPPSALRRPQPQPPPSHYRPTTIQHAAYCQLLSPPLSIACKPPPASHKKLAVKSTTTSVQEEAAAIRLFSHRAELFSAAKRNEPVAERQRGRRRVL